MLISELLFRKKYIKLQIDELRRHIINSKSMSNINEVLGKLYELEDQDQKQTMLLNKANRVTDVKIGNSIVQVDTALELQRNTSNKIDVLTDLIKADKEALDIFNLFVQRNKLIEEYIMITNAIKISDWGTEVD